MLTLPRLYAVMDQSCIGGDVIDVVEFARELVAGGITMIQYRNKTGGSRELLSDAREIKRAVALMPGGDLVRLIMNDRADLCLAADFDGVHLGQDDLSPVAARAILGPNKWIGISTHHASQVEEADRRPVDYIAVGPVFATATKMNPDPVIGFDGVRTARVLTAKPLVAIGGITRGNGREVLHAGADCVAVISDLLRDPRQSAEEFVRLLVSD